MVDALGVVVADCYEWAIKNCIAGSEFEFKLLPENCVQGWSADALLDW
jgi:hypothetical protein